MSFIENNNSINFNPRSLAGATYHEDFVLMYLGISIHAPSRERLR